MRQTSLLGFTKGGSLAGLAAQATTFFALAAGAVAWAWVCAKAFGPTASTKAVTAAHLMNDMKIPPLCDLSGRFYGVFTRLAAGRAQGQRCGCRTISR